MQPDTGFIRTVPERCRMCYTCVRECPAKAIQLAHYRDEQIIAKALAVVSEEVA